MDGNADFKNIFFFKEIAGVKACYFFRENQGT